MKPVLPTLVTVEPPTPPATSTPRRVLPSPAPSPASATRRPSLRMNGLPSRPAEKRRPTSIVPASAGHPSTGVVSTEHRIADHGLSPVNEIPTSRNSLRRTTSVALPTKPSEQGSRAGLDRSHSMTPRSPAPRRRDSLVLQRARAYDGVAMGHDMGDSRQATMETLSQFPMPPLPPLPPLPSIPASPRRERRVAW